MPRKGNAPPTVPTCHPDRPNVGRGMCKPCYDRDYADRNKGKMAEQRKAWARANPDRVNRARWKYRYGIEPEQVQAKLNAQDGLCKICRTAPATDIDHDHETGQVRGLLCGDCNRALGLFKEDRERLNMAIRYLEHWGKR